MKADDARDFDSRGYIKIVNEMTMTNDDNNGLDTNDNENDHDDEEKVMEATVYSYV